MTTTYAGDPVAGLPVDASGLARRGLVPLAVAVVYLLAYALTIVVPYVVDDLHTLPLAEVASGAHDPKDLWPASTAWGGVVQLGAMLVLTTGPPAVLAAGGWAAAALVARRRVLDRRGRVVLASALAVALAFLVLFFSPLGIALTTWMVD